MCESRLRRFIDESRDGQTNILNLQLLPTCYPLEVLGRGSYGQVLYAHFTKDISSLTNTLESMAAVHDSANPYDATIIAVKRYAVKNTCVQMLLRETSILLHLRGHPNVIRGHLCKLEMDHVYLYQGNYNPVSSHLRINVNRI